MYVLEITESVTIDFDTDIIEVLRESNEEIQKQLMGLSRDDFSEVYQLSYGRGIEGL